MLIDDKLLKYEVVQLCIKDIDTLLEKAGVIVDLNSAEASKYDVHLSASLTAKNAIKRQVDFDVLETEPGGFSWIGEKTETSYRMHLDAASAKGISNGLYGLLQDKLGFSFYHPRNMIVPEITAWPLQENFEWKAEPRFNKMGFHIHTMHPLELTQPLLDHTFPNGEEMIK
ncbi:MAG TPA: hypothetical protein VEB42_00200, partial [Chitinophagaceae bacterium]|nr:hypothetical protein [Chitinophagaceae bacterium]